MGFSFQLQHLRSIWNIIIKYHIPFEVWCYIQTKKIFGWSCLKLLIMMKMKVSLCISSFCFHMCINHQEGSDYLLILVNCTLVQEPDQIIVRWVLSFVFAVVPPFLRASRWTEGRGSRRPSTSESRRLLPSTPPRELASRSSAFLEREEVEQWTGSKWCSKQHQHKTCTHANTHTLRSTGWGWWIFKSMKRNMHETFLFSLKYKKSHLYHGLAPAAHAVKSANAPIVLLRKLHQKSCGTSELEELMLVFNLWLDIL